ncbi:hypothetical protein [uncultured Polaribacter sp.]|uniref:hypothetical protein n=1 Tax=uncultured Polaribacter sp. TaxID=174711 RepID=UPI0026391F67|nr:hypothetical protein [uncultured Polaribacter sp.]
MKKHIPRNFIILNPISYFKNQGSFLFPVILTILFTFINVSAVLAQDSFENNLDGWENVLGDDFDWTNLTGLTPTRAGNAANATGPTTGSNGSYYMYIETSFPRIAGNKAWFQKPFDFTERTKPQMSFNYHLFGATIGTLNVLVSANGGAFTNVFSISGNQGDVWRLKIIDLSAYAGQNVIIRFEGIVGSSFTGDLAIDNVNVFSYDKEEDVDNDGIADKNDLDSDNDGILNSVEGSCTLTQSGVWTMSGQTASYNFGNGVIANVVVTNNTATENFTTGAFNNLTAWEEDLAGDPSLQGVFNWNSVMTVTYVDTNGDPVYVENPIVNFDRIGGSEGTTQNSSTINLLNGLTWRKLAGTDDFLATSTSVRDDGAGLQQSATFSAESSQNDIDGTASGTVEIDGLVSTFTVNFIQTGPNGSDGDGIEFILFACKPTDSDGDGIPNHLDFDSDNDGCTDANEAYFGSVDRADDDEDGYYGVGTPTPDGQGRVSGASYNAPNSYYTNSTVSACNDTDNDGVPDDVDLDDDNDGVLDVDEGFNCSSGFIDLGQTFSNNTDNPINVSNIYSYDDVSISANFQLVGTATWNSGVSSLTSAGVTGAYVNTQPNNTNFENNNVAVYTYTFSKPVYNVEFKFGGLDNLDRADFSANNNGKNKFVALSDINIGNSAKFGNQNVVSSAGPNNAPNNAVQVSILGPVTQITITVGKQNVDLNNVTMQFYELKYCTTDDFDNDGIANHLDADSDGDGCSDADEAYYGSVTDADADNNGYYGSGTPNVDGEGKVTTASYTSTHSYYLDATVNTCEDNDKDGIPDAVDVDDDNDGILDTNECPTPVIYNDSFEVPNIQSLGVDVTSRPDADADGEVDMFISQTSIEGWTTTDANSFDIIFDLLNASDGNQSLDLYGTPSATGIQKTYTGFTEDVAVDFSLDYSSVAGLFEATVSVDYGSGPVLLTTLQPNGIAASDSPGVAGQRASSVVWSNYSATLTPTASGSIKIIIQSTSLGSGQVGVLIDNVSLSQTSCTDTDGDGVIDSFDTDSDNDGCPDAIEGAATLTLDKLSTFTGGSVGGSSQNLGSNVDANGSPIVSGQGATGFTQASTNDVKDANVSLACAIDLNITKKVDKPILKIGETVIFTLVLTNAGPQPATNVQVRDLLPAGLTYNAASSVIATNTTYNPTTGIWDLSSLTIGVNDSVELKIAAIINTLGVIITNNTEIFSTTETDKDSTPNSNN